MGDLLATTGLKLSVFHPHRMNLSDFIKDLIFINRSRVVGRSYFPRFKSILQRLKCRWDCRILTRSQSDCTNPKMWNQAAIILVNRAIFSFMQYCSVLPRIGGDRISKTIVTKQRHNIHSFKHVYLHQRQNASNTIILHNKRLDVT